MVDLRERLLEAASSPSTELDFGSIVARAMRRRRRREGVAAALMIFVVAGPLWLVANDRRSDEPSVPPATSTTLAIVTSTTEVDAVTTTLPSSPDPSITTPAPSTTSTTLEPSPTTLAPPAGFRNVSFKIVDENDRPLDQPVGINACLATDDAVGCPTGTVSASDDDGDGIVTVTLRSDSEYDVNAFVVGAGWPNPWIGDDGSELHFSPRIRARADQFADGTEIVLAAPISVEITVLDGDGRPLPAGVAGVMACEIDVEGECSGVVNDFRVADDVDGDGIVVIGLEDGRSYDVGAIARGAGWCNPQMTDDGGLTWHFGENAVGTPAELDGRQLVVADPCA